MTCSAIKNQVAKKNRQIHLLTGVLFLFNQIGSAQTLRTVTRLPPVVTETSGVEITDKNKIWTFNDSGGEPEIYLCDTAGNLIRTLSIEGAVNQDWEDITKDDQGNFYIGDFGNNGNDRTDLLIYKIPNPDQVAGTSTDAQIISFAYEDQWSFPPPSDSLYFDCEALMWYRNHLYLCTKNRTVPFDGLTHLYRLPDTSGHFIAEKIGSFDTKGNQMINYWITAGDISDDGTHLCLLSSDKMWLFFDFPEDNFFSGRSRQIDFNHFSQKEGICFISNNECYVTDKEWPGDMGRKLYSIRLDSMTTSYRDPRSSLSHLLILPNPFQAGIWIKSEVGVRRVEIFSVGGIRIHDQSENNSLNIYIGLPDLTPGVYIVQILEGAYRQMRKIIKL
jgi:hypothetical protein